MTHPTTKTIINPSFRLESWWEGQQGNHCSMRVPSEVLGTSVQQYYIQQELQGTAPTLKHRHDTDHTLTNVHGQPGNGSFTLISVSVWVWERGKICAYMKVKAEGDGERKIGRVACVHVWLISHIHDSKSGHGVYIFTCSCGWRASTQLHCPHP